MQEGGVLGLRCIRQKESTRLPQHHGAALASCGVRGLLGRRSPLHSHPPARLTPGRLSQTADGSGLPPSPIGRVCKKQDFISPCEGEDRCLLAPEALAGALCRGGQPSTPAVPALSLFSPAPNLGLGHRCFRDWSWGPSSPQPGSCSNETLKIKY